MCGVIQVDLVDYNRLTDLASLKNELSLKFTLWNIESAAIPIQKKDSRSCMGASAFWKSVDFRAFTVNVKTIAPKK